MLDSLVCLLLSYMCYLSRTLSASLSFFLSLVLSLCLLLSLPLSPSFPFPFRVKPHPADYFLSVVASTHAVNLIDFRFPGRPLLRWVHHLSPRPSLLAATMATTDDGRLARNYRESEERDCTSRRSEGLLINVNIGILGDRLHILACSRSARTCVLLQSTPSALVEYGQYLGFD